MDLDLTVHKGKSDMTVVILIHGMGMDKNIWLEPLKTKIFAKNIPLKVFATKKPFPCVTARKKNITLGKPPGDVRHLWKALKEEGFNLVCWSQKRPLGPIGQAVDELSWIVNKTTRLFPKKPISLIGHSRGGLVARKFMEKKHPAIKIFITLSAPHKGSSLAKLGKYLKPLSRTLEGILPITTHSSLSEAMMNIKNLLQGNALQELLPESTFYKNLKDIKQKGVKYISFGGTQPRFFTLYIWRKRGNKIYPKPLLLIPDSIIKVFPSFLTIDEVIPGKGDGLVSAKSSLLPWASKHYNAPVNHLAILWNKKVIGHITGTIKSI